LIKIAACAAKGYPGNRHAGREATATEKLAGGMQGFVFGLFNPTGTLASAVGAGSAYVMGNVAGLTDQQIADSMRWADLVGGILGSTVGSYQLGGFKAAGLTAAIDGGAAAAGAVVAQVTGNAVFDDALSGALTGMHVVGMLRSGWEMIQNACFAAGTPLLTPAGSKPIEDFRPGDRLFSRSGGGPERLAGSPGC